MMTSEADRYVGGRVLGEHRARQWRRDHDYVAVPELPPGWRYQVEVEHDEWSAADGYDGDGFGALEWGRQYRPHPEAIPIEPDAATLWDGEQYDRYNHPRSVLWWVPISSYGDDSATRANLTAMYRDRGMAKGPAYLAAVRDQQRCAEHLRTYPDIVGGVIVRVLDEHGSEVGSASLWGIDDALAWNGRSAETIAADEGLYHEALADAVTTVRARGRRQVCGACLNPIGGVA